MRTKKYNLLTKLSLLILVAVFICSTISVKSVEAAVSKPGNCRFVRWTNDSFTSFAVAWNTVRNVDGYQTAWTWTDGSHAKYKYHGKNVKSTILNNAPKNHVTLVKVRAFRWSKGKREYGTWSNVAYITPSPTTLTKSLVDEYATSNPNVRLRWNAIYGSNGYNVFLTTNPKGTWYWNQSTATKATANTAIIKKYRGSKLKIYQTYYVRIVTRRKHNNVFCTVPLPGSSYCTGDFWLYYK